jgi:hypothetical protein
MGSNNSRADKASTEFLSSDSPIELQNWQVSEIHLAIKEADSNEFISDSELKRWIKKCGS